MDAQQDAVIRVAVRHDGRVRRTKQHQADALVVLRARRADQMTEVELRAPVLVKQIILNHV